MADEKVPEVDKPELEPFWTLVLNEVLYSKGKYQVKGHFILCVLRVDGDEKSFDFRYLTPYDRPIELELPDWMFPDKRFDKISPDDIYRRFVEIFESTPCALIPEAPVPIPMEALPPRKRKKAKFAAQKAREKTIWPFGQGFNPEE